MLSAKGPRYGRPGVSELNSLVHAAKTCEVLLLIMYWTPEEDGKQSRAPAQTLLTDQQGRQTGEHVLILRTSERRRLERTESCHS